MLPNAFFHTSIKLNVKMKKRDQIQNIGKLCGFHK